MSTAEKMSIDATTYLEGEKTAEYKSEYINGDIYAMVGVSDRHATISLNLGAELRSKLKGKSCKPYIADMKVYVAKADAYFYPDVFVTCHSEDKNQQHDYFKEHPTLIIEVLSKSTEAFDRGAKFAHYRQLASLKEYWLVDPTTLTIDQYLRNNDETWQLKSVGLKTHADIAVSSLTDNSNAPIIPLADIFDGATEDPAI